MMWGWYGGGRRGGFGFFWLPFLLIFLMFGGWRILGFVLPVLIIGAVLYFAFGGGRHAMRRVPQHGRAWSGTWGRGDIEQESGSSWESDDEKAKRGTRYAVGDDGEMIELAPDSDTIYSDQKPKRRSDYV